MKGESEGQREEQKGKPTERGEKKTRKGKRKGIGMGGGRTLKKNKIDTTLFFRVDFRFFFLNKIGFTNPKITFALFMI